MLPTPHHRGMRCRAWRLRCTVVLRAGPRLVPTPGASLGEWAVFLRLRLEDCGSGPPTMGRTGNSHGPAACGLEPDCLLLVARSFRLALRPSLALATPVLPFAPPPPSVLPQQEASASPEAQAAEDAAAGEVSSCSPSHAARRRTYDACKAACAVEGPGVPSAAVLRAGFCQEAAAAGPHGVPSASPAAPVALPGLPRGRIVPSGSSKGPGARPHSRTIGAFLEGAPDQRVGRKLSRRPGALEKQPSGAVFNRHQESLGCCPDCVCEVLLQGPCSLAGRWPFSLRQPLTFLPPLRNPSLPNHATSPITPTR